MTAIIIENIFYEKFISEKLFLIKKIMTRKQQPPASLSALLQAIKRDYDELSPQLRTIAQHIEKHGEQLAFLGVQELADQCKVQPSAIVRFAKQFGFGGFSDLHAVFKAGAQEQLSKRANYHERIQSLIKNESGALPSAQLAREVVTTSIESLETLVQSLDDGAFDRAVNLLVNARAIWLAGARRSFPVASYLAYALQHTDKPVQWLHGTGLMHDSQLNGLNPKDVMVAISFEPYAQETLKAIQTAASHHAPVVLITDSLLSTAAKYASETLLVHDGATFGFRSLTSTLCLAQSLFLAMAYRTELEYKGRQATRTSSD